MHSSLGRGGKRASMITAVSLAARMIEKMKSTIGAILLKRDSIGVLPVFKFE